MKQRSRTTPLLAILALTALVLVGCGSSSGSSGSSDTSSKTTAASGDSGGGGSTMTITIKDFKFSPADAKAKVGDTITFKNEDNTAHTGTSMDGAPAKFDTGDIAGGSSKTVKVTKAGDYKYECSIHQYMKGTITVS